MNQLTPQLFHSHMNVLTPQLFHSHMNQAGGGVSARCKMTVVRALGASRVHKQIPDFSKVNFFEAFAAVSKHLLCFLHQ